MSKIFGGSKQKSSNTAVSQQTSTSSSSNRAFDSLSNMFSPIAGQTGTNLNAISALLSGDTSGFNAFKRATGFNAMADAGSRGITGNAAAGGLLRSGSTAKGLTEFGNNLQQQFAGNYMDRLLSLANAGFNAGNLISGAGNVSNSSSQGTSNSSGTSSGSSKNGLGGFLGQVAGSVAASDVRLKENLIEVGELRNGLKVYQYNYINSPNSTELGVLAQDVLKVQPDAIGPVLNGYLTVDYSKLEGWV